jgi:putative nucleotidyltransferase with HDIG domain
MSAIYRIRQFVRAAGAWVRAEDLEEVRSYLSPSAMSLFKAMPRYDRRHGIDVLHTLQVWGYEDPDLLAAALLHDVGKTADGEGRLRLWHRVAVVLMRRLWPGLLGAIGQDRPGSWRYPYSVQQRHAAIGAKEASKAGCPASVVDLILHHEDQPQETDEPLLAALRAADSVN